LPQLFESEGGIPRMGGVRGLREPGRRGAQALLLGLQVVGPNGCLWIAPVYRRRQIVVWDTILQGVHLGEMWRLRNGVRVAVRPENDTRADQRHSDE
jgi:hypothetical protein